MRHIMSKQLIALLLCSSLMSFFAGFNTLKCQEVLWQVDVTFRGDIQDCIIHPNQKYVVNTLLYGDEKIKSLQLRDIETGEIVYEKIFDDEIRTILIYDENSFLISGPGIVAVIDNMTFEIKQRTIHLFREIEGFWNIAYRNDRPAKHPFKNEVVVPIWKDMGAQLGGAAYHLDLGTLDLTPLLEDEYNDWGLMAYSPNGEYFAVGVNVYPYTIHLFDSETKKIIKTFNPNLEEGHEIEYMAFSPDSKTIISDVGRKIIKTDIEKSKVNIIYNDDLFFKSFSFLNNDVIFGGRNKFPISVISKFNIKTEEYTEIQSSYLQGPVVSSLNDEKNKVLTFKLRQINLATIDLRTSVAESKAIQLFPNPAINYVKLPKNSLKEIILYNTKGIKLTLKQKDHKIDVSNLTKGLYFLKINDKTYKIIRG